MSDCWIVVKTADKVKKAYPLCWLGWRNMLPTAIYTRLACVTLPLHGLAYKVAFLTPTSLDHNVLIIAQKALVNSKSYSECQKCLCAHLIFLVWFCLHFRFSFHYIQLMNLVDRCVDDRDFSPSVWIIAENRNKPSFSNNNSNHKT